MSKGHHLLIGAGTSLQSLLGLSYSRFLFDKAKKTEKTGSEPN